MSGVGHLDFMVKTGSSKKNKLKIVAIFVILCFFQVYRAGMSRNSDLPKLVWGQM